VKVSVKTHGFDELERALVSDFPKATAKNILRRAAINALKPIEARAKQLAPKDDGTLAESITTKPVKARRASRDRYESASGVTIATGPTSRRADDPGGNAAWQEEGTVNMPANPFMRPAWDAGHDQVLDTVRTELALQIDKARARIARKLAKAGK
jgi:HK97 gp10 family phage protein